MPSCARGSTLPPPRQYAKRTNGLFSALAWLLFFAMPAPSRPARGARLSALMPVREYPRLCQCATSTCRCSCHLSTEFLEYKPVRITTLAANIPPQRFKRSAIIHIEWCSLPHLLKNSFSILEPLDLLMSQPKGQ